MTGRHAAPRDELFDQRERETAGSHRAEVEVPLGPDDAPKKPAARAKAAPVKKAAPKATTSSRSKKAGTT